MAVFRTEKNSNFTVISNGYLRDKNMSIKAKGLMTLILSLPDDWNYSLKGLASINKDGMASITSAVNELIKLGYIKRVVKRHENGKISDVCYDIYENSYKINDTENDTENECSEEKSEHIFLSKNSPNHETLDEENQETAFANTEKTSLINTYIPNKKEKNIYEKNTYQSNLISENAKKENFISSSSFNMIDEIDNFSYYKNKFMENVEYDFFLDKSEISLVDDVINLMADVACNGQDFVRINSGEYPKSLVLERFLSLNYISLEYLIESFKNTKSDIKNIRQYLLTAIFNAPITVNSYYDSLVRADGAI